MAKHREFATFVGVGAAAAGLNWVSRIIISLWAPLEISVVIAHLIGMAFAYVAARSIAFRLEGRGDWRELGRFALVNVVSLAQTWLITILLMRTAFAALHPAEVWEAAAHGIGISSTALTSYVLHRHFTFAKARRAAADAQN